MATNVLIMWNIKHNKGKMAAVELGTPVSVLLVPDLNNTAVNHVCLIKYNQNLYT